MNITKLGQITKLVWRTARPIRSPIDAAALAASWRASSGSSAAATDIPKRLIGSDSKVPASAITAGAPAARNDDRKAST